MEPIQQNWTVISLGGSLIVPEKIDVTFLKNFTELLKQFATQGRQFAVITGGGSVAREYRDALTALGIQDMVVLDWMGISVTRTNAELLKYTFGDSAEAAIFLDPTDVTLTGKPILVGGGYRAGHSSDGSAVALAKTLGATTLINLSNIDYVYTADPRTNPDATPIFTSNWTDFRKLLPDEWVPGSNAPFDPVAAKLSQEMNLSVIVMNGKNLDNLKNYLDGNEFVGTVIK